MGIACSSSEEVPTHAHPGAVSANDKRRTVRKSRPFPTGTGWAGRRSNPPQQISGEGRGTGGHKACVWPGQPPGGSILVSFSVTPELPFACCSPQGVKFASPLNYRSSQSRVTQFLHCFAADAQTRIAVRLTAHEQRQWAGAEFVCETESVPVTCSHSVTLD